MKQKRNLVYDRLRTGERIRRRREQLNISRKNIARAMNLSEKYYSDIERGSCGMSLETAVEIASYLGLSLDYIIQGVVQNMEISEESASLLFSLEQCEEEKKEMAAKLLQIILCTK